MMMEHHDPWEPIIIHEDPDNTNYTYIPEDRRKYYFMSNDIKAAVEWLKDEMLDGSNPDEWDKKVLNLIDKAFEDVIDND